MIDLWARRRLAELEQLLETLQDPTRVAVVAPLRYLGSPGLGQVLAVDPPLDKPRNVKAVDGVLVNGKFDGLIEFRDNSAVDFADDWPNECWILDLSERPVLAAGGVFNGLYVGIEVGGPYYLAIASGTGNPLDDAGHWAELADGVNPSSPAAWAPGSYVAGFVVTHLGQTWLANVNTSATPGTSSDWRAITPTDQGAFSGAQTYYHGDFVLEPRPTYAIGDPDATWIQQFYITGFPDLVDGKYSYPAVQQVLDPGDDGYQAAGGAILTGRHQVALLFEENNTYVKTPIYVQARYDGIGGAGYQVWRFERCSSITPQQLEYSVDAYIGIEIRDYTVDAYLATLESRAYTVDARLAVLKGLSYTVNAWVAALKSRSYTVDASLFALVNRAYTVDAYLGDSVGSRGLNYTVDSYVANSIGSRGLTYTVDAYVGNNAGARKVGYSVDAYLGDSVGSRGVKYTVDAFLGNSVGARKVAYSVDSYVADAIGSRAIKYTVDSSLIGTGHSPIGYTVDAYLMAAGGGLTNWTELGTASTGGTTLSQLLLSTTIADGILVVAYWCQNGGYGEAVSIVQGANTYSSPVGGAGGYIDFAGTSITVTCFKVGGAGNPSAGAATIKLATSFGADYMMFSASNLTGVGTYYNGYNHNFGASSVPDSGSQGPTSGAAAIFAAFGLGTTGTPTIAWQNGFTSCGQDVSMVIGGTTYTLTTAGLNVSSAMSYDAALGAAMATWGAGGVVLI